MTAVVLDAWQLSGESATSGIGTYVAELLNALAVLPGIEVRALATADAAVPAAVERRTIRRHFGHGRMSVIEHEVRRSAELLIAPPGVFHNPNPHAPLVARRPWVQTLHDVIPLVDTDPVLAPLRRRWKRFGPRYRRAGAVIAVSRFAADQGIRHLGLSPKQLTVIHHGVSDRFSPAEPGQAGSGGRPYVSVVSEYSPRKGFGAAFEVAAMMADGGLPHTVKVAGRVPPWFREHFAAELSTARRPDRVEVLGFVEDLVPLYRGATAHLVTSRHEGFGFSALEAMACGTPVVAFANTAVREVVADSGLLVPDGDVAAAAKAVVSLARQPNRRQDLAAAAVERSRNFSWERCARMHADVYTHLAGG